MSEAEFEAYKAKVPKKNLPNDFSELVDKQDRIDMMNPSEILGNLNDAGMIAGQGFKAIDGGNSRGGKNRFAIEG